MRRCRDLLHAAHGRRIVDAAAQEARLIRASGTLAMQHTIDLTHGAGTAPRGAHAGRTMWRPLRRRAGRRRELASYTVAIVCTAILLAVFLFLIAPRTLPGLSPD